MKDQTQGLGAVLKFLEFQTNKLVSSCRAGWRSLQLKSHHAVLLSERIPGVSARNQYTAPYLIYSPTVIHSQY